MQVPIYIALHLGKGDKAISGQATQIQNGLFKKIKTIFASLSMHKNAVTYHDLLY